MKRFLPLLMLTGLLFGQDVLVAVNAEEYKGKFVDIKRFIIAKDKDYVLFKFDDRSLEFLMNEKIEKEWLYHNNTAQQLQKIPTRLIKEIRLADGEILDIGNNFIIADSKEELIHEVINESVQLNNSETESVQLINSDTVQYQSLYQFMQQRAARKRTVSAPYQIGVEENFFNIITDSDEIPFSSILSIADTKIILDSGIDINIHDVVAVTTYRKTGPIERNTLPLLAGAACGYCSLIPWFFLIYDHSDDLPLWIGNLTGSEDGQNIFFFGIFSISGIFAYKIVKRSIIKSTQKTIHMNGWSLEQKKDFLVQGMTK
tara:strand:+ start:376 stop:1323 length:948 start_codon:yes stop_codon:yes gene_type:complete